MKKQIKIKWKSEPEAHDYPAAASYLELLFTQRQVENKIDKFKESEMTSFKAKDIFRASGLSLLGISNSHVKKNIDKIKNKESMVPILLVRNGNRVIIADGYHRMCAVYNFNEDAFIPCKII